MYNLRISNSKDAEFAYDTVKVTMREFAIQTWGKWLDKECKKEAIEDTAKGKIQIITIGKEQAGTLQINKNEDGIVINQLYLLPPFQNKGVGGCILNELKEMAREMDMPIKLSVLQVNPAKHFYERNGFNIENETDERINMQYVP